MRTHREMPEEQTPRQKGRHWEIVPKRRSAKNVNYLAWRKGAWEGRATAAFQHILPFLPGLAYRPSAVLFPPNTGD